MVSFFENPLIEGNLCFDFGESPGATRYETWSSHLHVFQQQKKKAVDFLFSQSESLRALYFTEVKDFETITKIGKYKRGEYSLELAEDVARKFADSLDGFEQVQQMPDYADECAFSTENKERPKVAVFHWELSNDFSEQKRKHYMRLMTKKLRALLQGFFSKVIVENILDNPSTHWKVSRIGE